MLHIDLHSTPKALLHSANSDCNIIIGDRFGTSAALPFREFIQFFLTRLGYRVGVNSPFPGSSIITANAHPAGGYHALQIEISREIYMDEDSLTLHNGFFRLQRHLDELATELGKFALDEARFEARHRSKKESRSFGHC